VRIAARSYVRLSGNNAETIEGTVEFYEQRKGDGFTWPGNDRRDDSR
jgi:hypothetical protein